MSRGFRAQERLRGFPHLPLTRKQAEFGGLRTGTQTMRTARPLRRPPFPRVKVDRSA